jgi:hypothetical protein
MDQPAGLISVLLNTDARLDERDDAAMDLAEFDGAEVLGALVAVASTAGEDPLLLDTCGASIGEIWARQGVVDAAVVARVRAEARAILLANLQALAPGLLPAERIEE